MTPEFHNVLAATRRERDTIRDKFNQLLDQYIAITAERDTAEHHLAAAEAEEKP